MENRKPFQQDKRKTLLQFGIVAAILIILSVLGSKWHAKLDLTDDHRFTLSKPTKNMLKGLKDVVNVKILLTGKLPSNYTKLLQGTTDVLQAFKEASNGKVQFTFENPIEGKSVDEKLKISEDLRKQGIMPKQLTNQIEEGEGLEKLFVFPYAIVMANGKQDKVNLRDEYYQMDEDEILNHSENVLEYKFANCIKQLHKAEFEKIAYVMGNGELLNMNTAHALYLLGQQYDLDTIDINQGIDIPKAYKCIIICRPVDKFDEKIKFKIDQYVMNGGRILWYVDGVNCSLDTMKNESSYTAIPYDLNLDDMLLKYGVRVNNNMVEDLQCNDLPLTVGQAANGPDIQPLPWIYFPILTPTGKHPIINNLDAVSSRFAGTIDTIPNKDNHKTILLSTSQYSRALATPMVISFNSVRYKPKTSLYNKKYMPIAVVIEGGFSSLYENRMDPSFMSIYQDSLGKKFKAHTDKDSRMIVVSDADIMLNDFSAKRGPAELGFYTPTSMYYANKTFLLNCVEYLVDDDNLLEARSKDVQLRLLDKKRVKNNKTTIQFLNIALPILVVIFLGSAYFFFRKRKYEKALA
ncbi:MAG: gliding motility-associated transporter substrate-binding protein GldG [Bacteroidota bacterium]|jgi:gliding-associated putative ABC transporter substrate-binding component GldG